MFRFRFQTVVLFVALMGVTFPVAVPARAQEDKPAVATPQSAEPRVTKDLVYGEAGGAKQMLDVYQPAANAYSGARPGVLLVHGGGWIGGDKKFYDPLARSLALKGYVAVTINYRLAPQSTFPAQLDDVQRATRWIRAHADTYGVDTNRLGALGDSAGAHLVTFLGTRDTRDNSDATLAQYSSRVACVVDFYGPEDFTLPPTGSNVNQTGLALLKAFFGKTPQEAPELYRDGSPITFVNEKSAPFLIVHGTKDTLVPPDQSQRLFDALQNAHVEVRLALMYNQGHGFLSPGNPQTYGAMTEEFLARHLKP